MTDSNKKSVKPHIPLNQDQIYDKSLFYGKKLFIFEDFIEMWIFIDIRILTFIDTQVINRSKAPSFTFWVLYLIF